MSQAALPEHIAARLAESSVVQGLRRRSRFFSDTGDFTAIDYGDVIFLEGRYFLVTGYTREGRFGVEEQPKPWVPRVMDLESGVRHILKLVFYETFSIKMGDFTIPCFRSPEKEARLLELTRGHERFMQGSAVEDEAGNLVRILDIIQGWRLDKYIFHQGGEHRQYFEESLPAILHQFTDCTQAIGFIHQHGFRHGDIRRDHIYVEYDTGLFKWIDFDYDFDLPERPFALDLFELGNILLYIVGRGHYQPRDIESHPDMGERVLATITPGDMSLLARNRVVNLQKLFPYIPKQLNDIFLHFSMGSPVFYETVDEFHADLRNCVDSLF